MQALCAIATVIFALVVPGQHETPKSVTLVAGLSGQAPNVTGGLPRLPSLPRLPRVPRPPKWP